LLFTEVGLEPEPPLNFNQEREPYKNVAAPQYWFWEVDKQKDLIGLVCTACYEKHLKTGALNVEIHRFNPNTIVDESLNIFLPILTKIERSFHLCIVCNVHRYSS
jgi:hypothetical protein